MASFVSFYRCFSQTACLVVALLFIYMRELFHTILQAALGLHQCALCMINTQVSHNNHFMYFSGGKASGSGKHAWVPPTGSEKLTFNDFKHKVQRQIGYNVVGTVHSATRSAEYINAGLNSINKIRGALINLLMEDSPSILFLFVGGLGFVRRLGVTFLSFTKALDCERRNCTNEEKHYYFRITALRQPHYMFKELPFFQPKESIFIKEPRGQRGIHCRFGMSAVIAENHYDGSRNVIGLFGGRRRYILTHPNQCEYMCVTSDAFSFTTKTIDMFTL